MSTDTLDTVLGSPDIDALYIASPNSIHAAQASRAIASGKHVLVEKPAVPTAAQWNDLVAQARAAGVVLLEAMRTAYDPGTALVRSVLPALGTIRYASLRYQKRSARYDLVVAGTQVNIFDPELAGGALLDLGVYCIHTMVSLFGVPDTVAATSVPVPSGADGAGAILATYDGLIVDLAYSKITDARVPSEIQGEDGSLLVDDISRPRTVQLFPRTGPARTHTVDNPPHALAGQVVRFIDLVRRGADATRDQWLTAQTLRITDLARGVR